MILANLTDEPIPIASMPGSSYQDWTCEPGNWLNLSGDGSDFEAEIIASHVAAGFSLLDEPEQYGFPQRDARQLWGRQRRPLA